MSETNRNLKAEERPWGSWTILETGQNYKIKRIEVWPGCRLSLQMHFHRSEHWIVLSGTARVTKNGDELIVRVGESTFVPSGTKHRLENPGGIPLVIIEIAQGQHISEDDIVRFDDDYNRHLKKNRRKSAKTETRWTSREGTKFRVLSEEERKRYSSCSCPNNDRNRTKKRR